MIWALLRQAVHGVKEEKPLKVYLDLVVLLNFAVNAVCSDDGPTHRAGGPLGGWEPGRQWGALYARACVLPGWGSWQGTCGR